MALPLGLVSNCQLWCHSTLLLTRHFDMFRFIPTENLYAMLLNPAVKLVFRKCFVYLGMKF